MHPEFAQKMFFVMNKTDLLEGPDRKKALGFVSDRLRAETQSQSLRTFPLSSRRAMAAKSSGNVVAYASSGMKDLEDALGAFLSQERLDTFLASVVAKAARLIADLDPGARDDKFAQKCQRVRVRLHSISPSLSPGVSPELPAPASPVVPGVAEQTHQFDQPAISWPEALRTRGCPICARMGDAAFHFYASWQHALVVDEAAQNQFAAEGGFCPLHTWQFLAVSSPQGTSTGYAKLAEQRARQLAELAAAPRSAVGSLARLAPRRQQCAVCRELRALEADAARGLAAFLTAPGGLRAYRDSQGVCLRHLSLLAPAIQSANLLRQVLQHASRRFEDAAEDMQNYAMKHDGIRRWLQNQDEKDAYLRVIVRMAGGKAACALWEADLEV
jgi:hypothetical protein